MQKMKILLQHMNKNNDSDNFRDRVQVSNPEAKVKNHNLKIYSIMFLGDEMKNQELCANSRSTMAVL